MPESGKSLFAVRVHPKNGPDSIVIRLASSAQEAKELAKGKAGLADAPATAYECPTDQAIVISFREPASD
jgi:hypothetical protein